MFFVVLFPPLSSGRLARYYYTRSFSFFYLQKNKFIQVFSTIVPSSGKKEPRENFRDPSGISYYLEHRHILTSRVLGFE